MTQKLLLLTKLFYIGYFLPRDGDHRRISGVALRFSPRLEAMDRWMIVADIQTVVSTRLLFSDRTRRRLDSGPGMLTAIELGLFAI